jgi:glyoxylase-like metal-dependent hydrolase (beta-lactamase superfamily II)
MKLTDNVYLVGGGPFSGFGLTPDADSHVYLIDGGSELALVDCGLGLDEGFAALESNIRDAGFDPGDIGRAFITHYHGDHAGGARRVRDAFGAQIAISADAAPALAAGDEGATGLTAAKAVGVFPEEARLEPTPIDDPLTDGDERQIGTATIRFIATPGHSAGHGSYLLSGGGGTSALFAGDAVFWAGRILLQAMPDCDLQESNASVQRLAGLDFEAFLPGHGAITVTEGKMHPQMAVAEIEKLAVPKGIL